MYAYNSRMVISTDSIQRFLKPPLTFRSPFSLRNESSFHRLHKSQKRQKTEAGTQMVINVSQSAGNGPEESPRIREQHKEVAIEVASCQ